jgi:hypothetical protein
VNDLNIITNPLDQELMQGRRYAMVGMNPIMPKDDAIVTLHLDNEERSSQSLAPHSQLHGINSFGSNGITTTDIIDRHVGLDQLLVELAHLLEKRIWHQVDYSFSIDEHPRDRCAIKMAPNIQTTSSGSLSPSAFETQRHMDQNKSPPPHHHLQENNPRKIGKAH